MKHKGVSQIFLIAALTAFVLILVNLLAHRHFVRLDLTEDNEFTLSESSRSILKGLDDQVTLKLFFTKEVPSNLLPVHQAVDDLLDEFQRNSPRINIVKIDPQSSPQIEQEATALGIPPLQLNVIEKDKREVRKVYLGLAVLYADKKEILPVVADLRSLEYDLIAAILKVTALKLPKVGLLIPDANPNENPYEVIQKVLEQRMVLVPLSPNTTDLEAQHLDALIMVAPKNLPNFFVNQLDGLLKNGVSLIILAGRVDVAGNLMATEYQTGLEAWLSKQGIGLEGGILVEPKYPAQAAFNSGFVQYQIPYLFFVRVMSAGLNQKSTITNRLEEVVFPWATTLTINPTVHPDWKYEVLAESSEESFLQEGIPNVTPQAFQDMQLPEGSKKNIAALVHMPGNSRPARLVVVSNSIFMRSDFLKDYQQNLIFFQNLIDEVTLGDKLIGIRSRGKTNRPLVNLSGSEMATLRWTFVIMVPFLTGIAGVVLYVFRRRKLKKLSDQF